MFTIQSLYVHCIFAICSLYIHCIFTICSLYSHCICTICSLYSHCIFTICSLYIYCIFTIRSLDSHCIFTILFHKLRSTGCPKKLTSEIEIAPQIFDLQNHLATFAQLEHTVTLLEKNI